MKLLLYIFPLLLATITVQSQDFNYIHYDTKDGLAGSTVYDLCQDKDGFMWFATENGLSRFDGNGFKNFTVKDGLPDNEVLKLFSDSRGRIWISCFSKEICYYYQGSIFNKTNSALIKKVHLSNAATSFAEDRNGTVAIGAVNKVVIISSQDSLWQKEASSIYGKNYTLDVDNGFGRINLVCISNRTVYAYESKGVFTFLHNITEANYNPGKRNFWVTTRVDSLGRANKFLDLKSEMLSYRQVNGVWTHVNSSDGTWAIDTIHNQWSDHYLAGKRVSRCIIDAEGQLWFSTLGEGVYKLPSREIKTIAKTTKTNNTSEIFSIVKSGDAIIGGTAFSKAIKVTDNGKIDWLDFSGGLSLSKNSFATNRLYTIKRLSSGVVLLGFDAFLVKRETDKSLFNYIFPIKSIDEINPDTILVGTSGYVFKMKVKDLSITDTIWKGRSTKVFYNNGQSYIGTPNGLYEVNADKTYKYLGDIHPAFSRRITDIKCAADNTIWISTSDEGIVAYKDGRVKHTVRDVNGLSSNICKSLFLDHDFLWVATNKGINKIDLGKKNYPIIKYGISDGLPSDAINAIFAEDSLIWVGSPAGLTYFNPAKISEASICNLKLLGVYIEGREQKIDTVYQLAYYNNSIDFDYVAISMKSGSEIAYYYKLKGLDNVWRETPQGRLSYQSLPSGNYELELYAVNKFGVNSNTLRIHFSIAAPFWEKVWFYLLVFLLVALVTGLLVNWRNQKARRALEQKNSIQQQFAELEQQAMQAQMNPHFIFNCLNSIQQYILTNDKQKANQYLTGFASLIRQTLDISGKKTITVDEEIRYLTNYLDMEKMRFGDNFNYRITTSKDIRADYLEMPAMLLQPYVENALRHGIRNKESGAGMVEISFTLEKDRLCCEVKDNGVGRKRSAELKSSKHIEYQSKGMSLTEKRIALLNLNKPDLITVQVTDLTDQQGNACGTQINLKIPV